MTNVDKASIIAWYVLAIMAIGGCALFSWGFIEIILWVTSK